MKYRFDDLMIEITRRCNMQCPHCLRGGAQRKDIDVECLDTILKKTEAIGILTLTGGEPSLKPYIIDKIIDKLEKYKISVQNFFIATNGKKVTDKFLMSLIRLYSYCEENEISAVKVSTIFHENINLDNIRKLKAFRFTYIEDDKRETNPINQGRATKNFEYVDIGKTLKTELEIRDKVNEVLYFEDIYINANQEIIPDCDYSYVNQNKVKICDIKDFDKYVKKLAKTFEGDYEF
jgi:organic radical activating enzyme